MVEEMSSAGVTKLDEELAGAFRETLTEMMNELSEEEQEMVQDALDSGASSVSEALYIEPGTVAAMCQIGYAFYEAGRYEQARSIFALITSLDEKYSKAWRGLGAVFQVNKNYDMAIAMYRQAVTTADESGEPDLSSKVLLGECLMLDGQREAGRQELEEAVAAATSKAEDLPFLRRAKVILQIGDKPRPHIALIKGGKPLVNREGLNAIVAEVSAMASSPAELLQNYFETLLNSVSDEELAILAKAAFENKQSVAEAYDIDRPTIDAICQIGNSFYEVGQYNKAQPIFSLVVTIAPKYYPAWRGLGAVWQNNKQPEMAIICYREAILAAEEQGEQDIPSQVLFGEVLLQNGDQAEGSAALKQALSMKAKSAADISYQRRAKVLMSIGQKSGPKVVLLGAGNKELPKKNVEILGITEQALKSVDSLADLEAYFKELVNNAPEEELKDMALAILEEGATQLREVYHIDMATMDGLCQTANSFYQVGQYDKAAVVFAMLTNLDLDYGPAWRGLGAVNQATKQYQLAELYYRRAILAAENHGTRDIPSTVFLGEVLGLAGQKDEARKVLDSLNNLGSYRLTKEDMAYIHRAKLLKKSTATTKLVVLDGKKQRAGYMDAKLQKAVEAVSIEENAIDKSAEMYARLLGNISDDELNLIINAVKDGATNMAEAYGIERSTLDGMCQIGYSYYEAGRYAEAGPVLGLVTMLDPTHVAAWRGLGAMLQAQKHWQEAADVFALALHFADEQDVVELPSMVLRGECLIFAGKEDEGKAILEEALKIGDIKLQDQPYIVRAKALLNRSATGPKVTPIVLMKGGQPLSPNTDQLEGRPNEWSAEDRPINGDDILAVPELRSQAKEILEQIAAGNLSLANVAGIPDADVTSLYKAAATYAQQDDYENALLIASFVYMLEPANIRNVMFMAAVMMRMKNYPAAEELVNVVIPIMEHDNPLYELYIGEIKLMMGNKEEGATYLHKCLELCADKPEHRQDASRAQQLIKLYIEH